MMPFEVRALGPDDRELLDLLVRREAVVPVTSPRDLSRRLARDRRVLAVLGSDGAPLAFVHVALSRHFPAGLDPLLHGPVQEGPPRIATFYGITRVDPRLRGRAGELLHMACAHVLAEEPSVEVAATLSPMPGFRDWVRRTLYALGRPDADTDLERVARSVAAGLAPERQLRSLSRLAELWLEARDEHGRRQDPVARFHLGNGATVRDVLVSADASWHGLEQSLGVMVSYQYLPALAVDALEVA